MTPHPECEFSPSSCSAESCGFPLGDLQAAWRERKAFGANAVRLQLPPHVVEVSPETYPQEHGRGPVVGFKTPSGAVVPELVHIAVHEPIRVGQTDSQVEIAITPAVRPGMVRTQVGAEHCIHESAAPGRAKAVASDTDSWTAALAGTRVEIPELGRARGGELSAPEDRVC